MPIISLNAQSSLAGIDTYQVFTIINNTGRNVVSIRMSPEDNNSWEGEFLGENEIIQNGRQYSKKLRLSRSCTRNRDFIYDLSIVLEGGSSMSEKVNVCDSSFTLGGSVANNWSNNNGGNNSVFNNGSGNNGGLNPGNNSSVFNNSGGNNGSFNNSGSNNGGLNNGGINNGGGNNSPLNQLPTMMVNFNPNQAVSPTVIARINAAFASQGLAPASCSNNPIAVFTVNGQYTACAYPTSAFPPGNYRLDLQGL
jgi:hypothetical protein